MQLQGLFKKPRLELEKGGVTPIAPEVHAEATETCPKCKKPVQLPDLWEKYMVCDCGHHFRMNARERIDFITDKDSFIEFDGELTPKDVINFPGYPKKLRHARLASGEKEAVVTGKALVGGIPACLFVMEAKFMMGSMGTVAGEKITRLFEYATEHGLPVVGFTVSGGARMQEGILSLMQMAKTSGAVRRHSDAGGFYLAVLTDPTTGGVTASFAMEADITLAEPSALIGFAGPRVIEQTIRKKLPEDFQTAEFLLQKGFVDKIVPRDQQKRLIAWLLTMHQKEDGHETCL